MNKPKVAVIQFPGNNCETETARAIRKSNMQAEIVRWNKEAKYLSKFDAYILGGGFGYEDRGRAGIVISRDPIIKKIKSEAKKGKPVLGICNGAQALVESGMIPGIQNESLDMALARNKRVKDDMVLGTGFYNSWVTIKSTAPKMRSVFNWIVPEKTLINIPVAHGEGRFATIHPDILDKLVRNHQILFRYAESSGAVVDEFPTNPNGALYNIAAVCNPEGNVMAIMPHPERGPNPPGKIILDSLYSYLTKKIKKVSYVNKFPGSLDLSLNKLDLKPSIYKFDNNSIELFVSLIITDNEAFTIEKTLQKQGFPDVTLSRMNYYKLNFVKGSTNIDQILMQTIQSGILVNTNKELVTLRKSQKKSLYFDHGIFKNASDPLKNNQGVIVVNKGDLVGKSKTSQLKKRLKIKEINSVTKGTVWLFQSKQRMNSKKFNDIIRTHLFYNPHSQDCAIIAP